jgi:hypothetical protein
MNNGVNGRIDRLERLLGGGACPEPTFTFVRHDSLTTLPPIVEDVLPCRCCFRHHEVEVHEVVIHDRREARALERLQALDRSESGAGVATPGEFPAS